MSESITNGTEPGCFSPHEAVTRGQIITFLYRLDDARGNNPQTTEHPFVDVLAAYQHVPVGWAYLNNVTKGTSATTFAPNANVTRGDFGVLLWRYAGEPEASAPHPFVDVTRSYQQDAVAWMAETGITTGTSPTTFNPEGTMTRAEAATFLFRFMGRPSVSSAELSATSSCLEPLRNVLVAAGLTTDEAVCAAPMLVDFGLDHLVRVLDGVEAIDGDMILAIADIAVECIPLHRRATVIQLFV